MNSRATGAMMAPDSCSENRGRQGSRLVGQGWQSAPWQGMYQTNCSLMLCYWRHTLQP